MFARWRDRLLQPRDAGSLAAFRFLFGTILCASSVRFLSNGWVDRFYVQPTFFFKYWGFEWVRVLPEPWMTVLYVSMAVLAAFVAVGFAYRVSIVGLFFMFTYVELVDVTNYLNHYYLVSLLLFLMSFLPLHRTYSVDAWIRPGACQTVPAWMLYLLRFQIGVVYFYAGIAKLQPDWLIHGQPLGIWLAARTEIPGLGALFTWPAMPHIMSWAGFLNDTLVVPFLLWRTTRPYAFATVFVFHLCTHLLFVIGVFPFLMVSGATLFFDADWPRKAARGFGQWVSTRRREVGLAGSEGSASNAPTMPSAVAGNWSTPVAALVAAYCVLQVVMPLRANLYPGDVLWHEQGMRYAWRVMAREKNGSVSYRVRWRGADHELRVPPSQYLTSHQEREMSVQPDLILQLAHRIAADFEREGYEDVQVRADVWASLNGRRAARLIDPGVDLAKEPDTLALMRWITPRPSTNPLLAYQGDRPARNPLTAARQAIE